MNVRRVGVWLGACVAVLAATVQAEDAVALRYKLAKGDKLLYRTKMQMQQSQSFMGTKFENEMNQELVASETVADIDGEGNAKLAMKHERLKMKARFPNGEFVFDSQSSERDLSSEISKAVTPLLERLSTASIQLTVSPQGEIKELKGYQDLLGDLLKDNALAAQFAGGGTDEAAKMNYQDWFPILADKAVKPDDKWERSFEFELPQIGKFQGKTVYRYVGPDKVGDRHTAKIEMITDLTLDLKVEQPMVKVTGKFRTTSSSGTLQFDPTAGRLVSAEATTTIAGDMTIETGGMVIPAQQEQTIHTTVEMLDKLPE